MKIYINNFNLNILDSLKDDIINLHDFIKETEVFIELFTDFGIYRIDNKTIYLLEPIDKDIIKYNNFYNNLTFILDSSYFEKKTINYINGNKHYSVQIKRELYKINSDSKVKLIIESQLIDNEYKPNDIYFECQNEININDLFIKQELIVFLSTLN
jgi:hypothetical protein